MVDYLGVASHHRLQQSAKVPEVALHRRRARTARSRIPLRLHCSPASCSHSVMSNFAISRGADCRGLTSSLERSLPSGVFCHANITWNSGCARACAPAVHLHDLLERNVLILLRRQGLSPSPAPAAPRPWAPPIHHPHRQRVHEKSDQILDLAPPRFGHRRPNHHLLLPNNRPSSAAHPASNVSKQSRTLTPAQLFQTAVNSSPSIKPTTSPA